MVSALRDSSPLKGRVHPGDCLEAIDGEDVRNLRVSDVTAIMAAKSDQQRVLTIATPKKISLNRSGEKSESGSEPPSPTDIIVQPVTTSEPV